MDNNFAHAFERSVSSDPTGPTLHPLTIAQRDIWIAHVLDPASDYAIACAFEFLGTIDVNLLERALRQTVAENDGQHLYFASTEHGPRQYFRPISDFDIPILDFSSEEDPFGSAMAWMRADRAKGFDLANGPLFRYALIRTARDGFFAYAANHHLINDWFGSSLLFRRTSEVYAALLEHRDPLSSRTVSVLELLKEDAAYHQSERHSRDRVFWCEQLANRSNATTLSGLSPGWLGNVLRSEAIVPGPSVEQLKRLGAAHGESLTSVIMAAMAIYLARMTGSSDITLGLPVTGRTSPTMRRVVGVAANILPLRLSIDWGGSIGALLKQVGRRVRDTLRHQRYSASELRKDLGLTPDQPALYGTIVNFRPLEDDVDFAGIPVRTHDLTMGRIEDFAIAIFWAARVPTCTSLSTRTSIIMTRARWNRISTAS